MTKILLISDTHFGFSEPEKELPRFRLFQRLLRYAMYETDEVWFLGDIFDFWFEYRNAVPSGYFELLHTMATLRDSGIKLRFVPGNHDCWMLDHLKSEMGLEIVNGQIKENLFGKNLLAGHGDEYSGGDKAYILFKALLRASWFTSIYRLLHPDIAIPAGKMLSRGSRSKPKDRFRLVSRYYRNVVRKRFAEGYDIVITGHTHTPVLKVEKGRIYLNPGGWMIERTFAEMDEEKVRLMEWRENQGPVMLASTSMRSPVERDTSEIGYNL